MNVIRKSYSLPSKEYYTKHIGIVDAILTNILTNKEIEVLAAFMSADPKLTVDDRFNTLVRKQVMRDLNISAGGLGNYFKSMISKRILVKNEITKRITINPLFVTEGEAQGYQFKLTRNANI